MNKFHILLYSIHTDCHIENLHKPYQLYPSQSTLSWLCCLEWGNLAVITPAKLLHKYSKKLYQHHSITGSPYPHMHLFVLNNLWSFWMTCHLLHIVQEQKKRQFSSPLTSSSRSQRTRWTVAWLTVGGKYLKCLSEELISSLFLSKFSCCYLTTAASILFNS